MAAKRGRSSKLKNQAQLINRPVKTILILSEYGVLNGGEHSLLAVLSSLTGRRFDSDFTPATPWQFIAAVPKGSELEQSLLPLGIVNRGLSLLGADGMRLSQTEIRDRLDALLIEVQPDLVHSNSLAISRLVGPVSRRLAIPSVGYLRDILKLSQKAIADLNCNDRLIAVSEATKQFHVQQGMDRDRIEVIHNGVDQAIFSPNDDVAKLEDDTPTILFVGQIGMRKGLDVLLDVVEKLVEDRMHFQCWIVGERNSNKSESIEFEQRLRLRSQHPSLIDRVRWLGRRSDVHELMRRSTVLLHPARQEPLGRVLLEAAATGLPIVTTDVGGTREILVGEASRKLMVPKDDVRAIVECLKKVLQDRSFGQTVSRELRLVAEEKFSISKCARQLDAVYRQRLGWHGDA